MVRLDFQFENIVNRKWIEKTGNLCNITAEIKLYVSSSNRKAHFYIEAKHNGHSNGENHVVYTIKAKQLSSFAKSFDAQITPESFIMFSFDNVTPIDILMLTLEPCGASSQFKSGTTPSLRGLYDSRNNFDITLKSEGHSNRKIRAHRNILAHNSVYFQNMFSSSFSESDSKEVEISCSFEALEIIIYYIYTGSVKSELIHSSNFDLWEEVFQITHFMNIQELSKIALWFSHCLIGPSNAFRLIKMCLESKNHGSIHLNALEYVKTNWGDISELADMSDSRSLLEISDEITKNYENTNVFSRCLKRFFKFLRWGLH